MNKLKKTCFSLMLIIFSVLCVSGVFISQGAAAATPTLPTLNVILPANSEGEIGTSLTLEGKGFTPSRIENITFNNQPLIIFGQKPNDVKGNFKQEVIVPKGQIAGDKPITARDENATATTTFKVLPSLVVATKQAKAGDTIKISGNGYHPKQNLGIYINDIYINDTTSSSYFLTDSLGEFTIKDFYLPADLLKGSTTLTIEDIFDPQNPIKCSNTLNIIELSPSSTSPSPVDKTANVGANPTSKAPTSAKGEAGTTNKTADTIPTSTTLEPKPVVDQPAETAQVKISNNSSSNWQSYLIYISMGVLVIIIGVLIALLFNSKSDSRSSGEDIGINKQNMMYWQGEYKKLSNEYQKLKSSCDKSEQLRKQIPDLKPVFTTTASSIKNAYPEITQTSFRELLNDPETEYWAFNERIRSLKAIRAYFDELTKQGSVLKKECLILANNIKSAEPELFNVLTDIINNVDIYGLIAIKPVLEEIDKQTATSDISPIIKEELAKLEKSLEEIRDYRYRLIPSRLTQLANELTSGQATSKENNFREKTASQIIKFVKEYLSL